MSAPGVTISPYIGVINVRGIPLTGLMEITADAQPE